MNKTHAFALFASTFLAGAALSHGAETPTITISKSDKIAVAIGAISGADGAQAAKILQNDLTLSGTFTLVPAASAGFVISGTSAGGNLSGSVTDRAGKTVLSESFSGTARGTVHAFSDAIVETLTTGKGFANTKVAFVSSRHRQK